MRAEELWLVGASPWLMGLWLNADGPQWLAVAVAAACVAMSVNIYRKRRGR